MLQFSFQPIESFSLHPLLVAADEATNVFADILIGPRLADIGRDELTEGAAQADCHRDGRGTADSQGYDCLLCKQNGTQNKVYGDYTARGFIQKRRIPEWENFMLDLSLDCISKC